MTILVTGAAGFIGFHVSQKLLQEEKPVIGIDNLNDYYDPTLKESRLNLLKQNPNFTFYSIDISQSDAIQTLESQHPEISSVIHLAAQAGVRYSLTNPHVYAQSNLIGHLNLLELARNLKQFDHFLYASSSSVYGANTKLPFSIQDNVDHPISLYAATKKSGELMAHAYSHLYNIPMTGLRFFTVYGPWGRPDMSAYIFTKAIIEGHEIPVFNEGNMRRNFTYIDDIVQGVLKCHQTPPKLGSPHTSTAAPHRVYNIGNNRSEKLMDFIQTIENITGKTANLKLLPMQPGDVKETIADISETTADLGFMPKTNIEEGLKKFVDWYQSYHQ